MTEAVWIVLIVQSFGLVGLMVKAVVDHKAKKSGNNPHPCGAHGKWIKELDDKLDEVCERISRIEGRLNGLK